MLRRRELSWQNVGLLIERLLALGSIPELAMRRCVLGKDIFIGAKQSTRCAQSGERLANRIQKGSGLVWLDRRRVLGS